MSVVSPVRAARYPAVALASCCFFWIFVQIGRFILPPLAIPIQDAFGIGNAEFGLAITSLWAMYALMQFPSGVINDYTDSRFFLTSGLLVLSAGFGSLFFINSYALFILVLILIGFGTSLFLLTCRLYVSSLYGENKGRALGIHTASGDVGGFLAPIIATALLGVVFWRTPFIVICLILLIGSIWMYFVLEGEFQLHLPERSEFGGASFEILRNTQVRSVTALYSILMAVMQAMYAFVPLYLYTAKDLPIETANLMLTVFFAVGVVIRPIGGWVSDILNRFRMLLVSAYSVAAGLVILVLFAHHIVTIVASLVLLGASLKILSPVVQAFIIESVEDESLGASFGITRTVYIFIGSLGPAVLGFSSEYIGFNRSLLLFAVLITIAVTVVVVLLRSHRD